MMIIIIIITITIITKITIIFINLKYLELKTSNRNVFKKEMSPYAS